MSTCVYHLTFKTALHLGRASGPAQTGKLGLEKTETYIPADTLFSALCHTWATFYGTESLTQFLDPYTTESDTLPFMLTSAFPFAYDIHFYPNVNGLDKHASSLAETHDNSPPACGGVRGGRSAFKENQTHPICLSKYLSRHHLRKPAKIQREECNHG